MITLIQRTLAVFACLACVNALPAAEVPTKLGNVEGVSEYKLANGLRILLIPDGTQPKVTVNCTIFVGSRHEGYGETGMAHLLEHMVFKGCPKFPDVPKALRDHGASFNGTTWVDRTNYFETMPADDANLEFGIELEADRLVNSFIAREELMKEFSVVRNEFERGENDPEGVLMQRMLATAFEWHNYGKSTIGNRTDIERVPIENLQAFYKKYYRPDNAMLIVAGKFDEKKALEYIVKYFGPLKNPNTELPKTYTEEPAQDGERIVTLRRVGSTGATGAVYHIPSASHADFAACEILNHVLTSEPNGRLYKALVETKKSNDVSGIAFSWHDPSVLILGAQTDPAKTEEARDILIDTLENLGKSKVTDQEVDRARQSLLRNREQTLANSQRFAVSLSDWAGCGDWRLFFLHRDRLEKVTADDVNRVAAKYLIRSNRTVGTYVPMKDVVRADVPNSPEIAKLVENYKGRAALATGEVFDPTPANVNARVQNGIVGEGVKYALLPKKTRGETVSVDLVLRFGNPESLQGNVTAMDFLGPLMERGTTTKNRQQIKDEFSKLNASVGFDSGRGALTVRISTKRDNLPAVLELVGDILRHPSFPEQEFEVMQREQIASLEKNSNEPQVLASTALRRKLSPYPPTDVRYTPTIDESIARLRETTTAKVKAIYDTQLGSNAGELAIVGDFDPEKALATVNSFLSGWKAKTPYQRITSELKTVAGSTEKINTPDKANAVYVAGLMLPLKDTDMDYAPMVIGNYLLGQSPLSSRLSVRVRGKEGLSYGVGSHVVASAVDDIGTFMIFAITNPKNIDKVDSTIAEEVNKFLSEGLSADELEQGKKAYLQSLKVSRGNDSALAGMLVKEMHAGRTFAYYDELEKRIEAVQPTDVKKAFDRLIDAKKLVIIEAGDFEKK